ncbi:ATPase, partial [Streptomyces sp. SID11233]|nr:ATPase [Streptomyces sp. SID11233]
SIDTWQEAEDAKNVARLVQAAATYGNRLTEERDLSAQPLLEGKREDAAVLKARAATDTAAKSFDVAARDLPHTAALDRRMADFRSVEPKLGPLRQAAYTKKLTGVQTEEGYLQIQHPL